DDSDILNQILYAFGNISGNLDNILFYLIWGILIFGVFGIFWAIFKRLSRKNTEMISSIFFIILLFIAAFILINLFHINLFPIISGD
ncbi:MAG: hypothetical protein ACTSVL_06110, partial [Promethearchaeota archaeon]